MENTANVIPFPGPFRAPLKIACFSYSLPRPQRRGDGIDRVAHDLAQGLAKRGHEVTVWSFDPKPEGASYEVRRLPGRRIASHWLGKQLVVGNLGNWLGLLPGFRDADVILAHADSLLLPVWGKPVVRIVHANALLEAASAETALERAKLIFVHAQDVVTALTQKNSIAAGDNVRRHNPFVGNIIPNGVDLTQYKPAGHKSETPSILFVGSLDRGKRGRKLLEWFWSEIRPRHLGAALWMVSEKGPAMPGVTYYSSVSQKGLARLYQKAWVFASPSHYEGSGLPYLKAMASGTPVLAHLNAGSREILGEGRYGCLSTDADFPHALNRLLGDAESRLTLTTAGLERASQFDLDLCLDRYEQLLRAVCGK